jgi:hypothetical protein
MKGHKRAAKRIALVTGVITLITACIYLAVGIGAGKTEYQCSAANSCSKTEVRECRGCQLLPSTISGMFDEQPPGSKHTCGGSMGNQLQFNPPSKAP